MEVLTARERLSPQEIAALQGDTTSRAARAWVRRLARSGRRRRASSGVLGGGG